MGVDLRFCRHMHVSPFCAIWHDSQRRSSWFAAVWHRERHKRRAAARRTWLSVLCPAPGRQQASSSHFNYGRHCLKTHREKATHRFLWRSPHTLSKMLYGAETFPGSAWDLYLLAQRHNRHNHTYLTLTSLTCLRRAWICMYHPSISLKVTESSNKRLFFWTSTWHLLVPSLLVRGFPLPQKWFLLAQAATRGQQPDHRMEVDSTCPVLPPSFLLRACLSFLLSDWLPTVCRGFLPLTTESWLSSNVKRMRSV